jgi:hypothetical protein
MKNYDLKYFIIRTNILLLYREAFKFTYQVKDISTRFELQNYIRNEFELNRNLEDRKKIEYLIGNSRKKLNTFKETFYMSK